MGQAELPAVSHMKDLGVTFSDNLKFSEHTNLISRKGFYLNNLIFRNFLTRDVHFLHQLFITYVLPYVEYCSEVTSPYLLRDIRKLESVQRHFTRRIPVLRELTYPERLEALDESSLELRRLCKDLVMVYRILHGYTSIQPDEFFVRRQSEAVTRGHPFKLFQTHAQRDCRKFSFAVRTVAPWNSLPQNVVQAKNPTKFKDALKDFVQDLSRFTKGGFQD